MKVLNLTVENAGGVYEKDYSDYRGDLYVVRLGGNVIWEKVCLNYSHDAEEEVASEFCDDLAKVLRDGIKS